MPIEDRKLPKATVASDVRGGNGIEGTVSKVRDSPPPPPPPGTAAVFDFYFNALPCFCLSCFKKRKFKD